MDVQIPENMIESSKFINWVTLKLTNEQEQFLLSTFNVEVRDGETEKIHGEFLLKRKPTYAEGIYDIAHMSPLIKCLIKDHQGIFDAYQSKIADCFIQETARHNVHISEEKLKEIALNSAKSYLQQWVGELSPGVAIQDTPQTNVDKPEGETVVEKNLGKFSVTKITEQIEYLNSNPKHLRRGKFYLKEDGTVDFMDIADGPWCIAKFPSIEERNRWYTTEFGKAPANTAKYVTGIDPHRHNFS